MKYYIIAGEASGDLHGSNLMKEIGLKDSNADFRFWGGDKMKAVGGALVKHISELAFMGFIEVLMNLRTILRNMRLCKSDISAFNPDALILIDYPGFNLRIAEWAFGQNRKVFYYISPQVWAWKSQRSYKLKKFVNALYVILPFEKNFFKKYDFDVQFVGHPLLDEIATFKPDAKIASFREAEKRPIVALLPGSRKQEISKILPTFLLLTKQYPGYTFVLAGAPEQTSTYYRQWLEKYPNVTFFEQKTYDLLSIADFALVSSGTATMEAALFDVPQVVVYKGSAISFQIAKRLVDVPFISLVNLVADQELVTELLQDDFTVTKLEDAFEEMVRNKTSIEAGYGNLRKLLGGPGASAKVAKDITSNLSDVV